MRRLDCKKRSTFSLARRLWTGASLVAHIHTWHIVSAGVGNCQHNFQGSIVLPEEHNKTRRAVQPGSKAFLMASLGPILHCFLADTRNSSHVPQSCAARLRAFRGASRLHKLSSSSVAVSGRFSLTSMAWYDAASMSYLVHTMCIELVAVTP